MEDQKQGEQHWQELAELFGLPPEKPASGKAAPAPASKPVEVELPRVEAPPPLQERDEPRFVEEVSRLEPVPEETPGWEAEFDAEDPDDTAIVDEQSLAEDTAADVDSADFSERPAAGSPEVDKPRRGRRRRRRGKRRDGEGEGREGREPAAAPTPARQEARSEPAADDSRGRNRHRSSRRDEDDRRRAPVEAAVDEEWSNDDDREKRESENRPLSLEDTDFTNWNVPSWQDLIASLYRPDR